MNTINKFIKIWKYKTNNIVNYDFLTRSIPKILQLMLTSDGSFTRNISIINNENLHIDLIKTTTLVSETKSNNQIDEIIIDSEREVWLIKKNTKIVFALSSWQTQNTIISSFSTKIPIGKTLIASELNIHRELHSIYSGYSTPLEQDLQSDGPLWGRRYQIFFDKQSAMIIDEIFAPNNITFIP